MKRVPCIEWLATLCLLLGSGVTPAVAGNKLLVSPGVLKAPAEKGIPPQARQYYYQAETRAAVKKQGKVTAGGLGWQCRGSRCTLSGPWPTPAVGACRALAKQVGPIRAYGHAGKKLSTTQLKQCNAGVASPVRKPLAKRTRQTIQAPPVLHPVVPAAPAIRPTGRSTGPVLPSLPKSKRFGHNKPVTGPVGKSLLPTPLPATAQPIRGRGGFAPPLRPGSAVPGIKQMRTDPRHLLEGAAPATLGGRGVSASVTGTIQADLVIEDISLDASRRAVLVKWREAQHQPLPAGSFDWAVGLGGTHMASTDRMHEAGNSLRRFSGTDQRRHLSGHAGGGRDSGDAPGVAVKSANMLPIGTIGSGTVHVAQDASHGQFLAPLDLYAGLLRDQAYLTVKVVLNTGGHYPEASRENDTLTKQLPYPRHTGRQLVPGEIPSQIISVSSRPARGSEHVTIRYSLSGSHPGRLGIQWKVGGATLPLDCYPNGGDGLALAPHGLNQQLEFVCQIPVQRHARTDRAENATITTRFYDGVGHRLPDYTTPAVLHWPHSASADTGHPDLDVQIILAQRYNGKPWVTVRIRNAGNAPSPQSRVVLEASPTDDGACRWPHGAHKTVPVLAPAEVFDATLPGDYCHGEPGTYRVNAQADRISLTARVDSTGDELNRRNNSATRLLKDALRDSPAENLVTRISSVVLTDPPTDFANCAHHDAHIRIDGGPFSAPITAELRSDAVRSGGIVPPTVRIESGTRLVATTRACIVFQHGVQIRLHYANDRSSPWQIVEGTRLDEQRSSGRLKPLQAAP